MQHRFGLPMSIYEQLQRIHIHPERRPDGEPYLKKGKREKIDVRDSNDEIKFSKFSNTIREDYSHTVRGHHWF